jgi:hypothetical protein
VRDSWHCAVLHTWDNDTAQPLTPVAAVSWTDGATVADLNIRWIPALTEDDVADTLAWRDRLDLADTMLPAAAFLAHAAHGSLDVTPVAVPDSARTVGGAADLLLDDMLAADLFPLQADTLFPLDVYITDNGEEG